jgi:macrolide transport system ATP-binding/permease protein
LLEGLLDADSAHSYAQDPVIDDNARKALFPDRTTSPVGRIILVGRVPCRIIGVTRQQQSGFGSSASPTVYLPYTTVQARFLGDLSLRSISIRVDEATPTHLALHLIRPTNCGYTARGHGAKTRLCPPYSP